MSKSVNSGTEDKCTERAKVRPLNLQMAAAILSYIYRAQLAPEDLWRFVHWLPLGILGMMINVALSGAVSYFLSTSWFEPIGQLIFWTGFANFMAVLYLFVGSVLVGPGFNKLHWKPLDLADTKVLDYCTFCDGYKPLRSHHCSTCKRCVLTMDHHCPFVNTCIGQRNKPYVLLSTVVGLVGAFYSLMVTACYLNAVEQSELRMYADYVTPSLKPEHFRSSPPLLIRYWLEASLGQSLSIAMILTIPIGALSLSVHQNRTYLERWILMRCAPRTEERRQFASNRAPKNRKKGGVAVENADHCLRHKKTPFNVGSWRNWSLVMLPFFHGDEDRIYWPVREGSDRYIIMREHQAQKRYDWAHRIKCDIVEPFNPSWFIPFNENIWTWLNLRLAVGAKLAVAPGDSVVILCSEKYWLYGVKVVGGASSKGSLVKEKGWIPRRCARLLVRGKFQ